MGIREGIGLCWKQMTLGIALLTGIGLIACLLCNPFTEIEKNRLPLNYTLDLMDDKQMQAELKKVNEKTLW